MKFITFTGAASGNPITINLENVTIIVPFGNGGCRLTYTSSDYHDVKESHDEILKQLIARGLM